VPSTTDPTRVQPIHRASPERGESVTAGRPFEAPQRTTLRRALAGTVVAIATGLVIVGVTMALFFNPAWVSLAQGRTDAAALTGWTSEQVDSVTRDIVLEVWLGPGTFAQDVAGEPVFNERERAHMADVRQLVMGFYALVLGAGLVLLGLGLASGWSRRFWRAVATGAKILVVGAVAVGVAFALVFDLAFTLFHRLFFAEGTWTFDPATDRLVQLFPFQFWTETTVVLAAVGLLLAIGAWAGARRMGRPGRLPAVAVPPAPGEKGT
jgi:integral membrane protein (TIGR01906 family)